jgi:hypothetical protein
VPGSWASLIDEDDIIAEEVLAPMTPPATKSPAEPCEGLQAEVLPQAEGLQEETTSNGWREVPPFGIASRNFASSTNSGLALW